MDINELMKEVHQNAVEHGWWDEKRSFGDIIALCHSELSEAFEEYRNGHNLSEIYTHCKMEETKARGRGNCGVCAYCPANKPEGIPVELADCIIRILDYCGNEGIDIHEAIKIKHKYNKSRPYRHGGKKL